ncbi:hypothetical protein OIU85_008761 [Salix viminalis]|uniref:Uncharacterized protein n=1 Tax=Salix viminalis TaxID=40686 RepID=A0A9Q0NYE3_SALVM|nr:hypothetical protein OIU85_008761 [Salix viminalis]
MKLMLRHYLCLCSNLVANNFTVGASNLRKVYVIDVIGAIPDELWSLTYLTNFYGIWVKII